MKFTIDIESAKVARFWAYVTLAALLFVGLYYGREITASLLIAGFIGVAVHRPAKILSTYLPGHSQKLAATLVFIMIISIAGLIVWLVLPLIAAQARELITRLPGMIAGLETGTEATAYLERFAIIETIETMLISIIGGIFYSAEATRAIIQLVISNVFNALLTIAIGFLLAIEGPRILKIVDILIPESTRSHVQVLRGRMYGAINGFVSGQLIITSIAATLTYLLLLVFGIPSPLPLAAVIWLTGLVPLIGNTLGAIIVILIAMSQSVFVAIFLSIYYVVYQQIENNLLEPIVQAHTVHLTPLIVLVSALIGLALAGFAGALLAIPAGACVRILVTYCIEQNQQKHRSRGLAAMLGFNR